MWLNSILLQYEAIMKTLKSYIKKKPKKQTNTQVVRHGAIPPPTAYIPGSEGKVQTLEDRRSLGQQLFNPLDKKLPQKCGFAGEFSGGDNVFITRIVRVDLDGEVVELEKKPERAKRRRTPEESEIPANLFHGGQQLYDFIRMLDADGYPRAFIHKGPCRIEFSNARLDGHRVIATAVFE